MHTQTISFPCTNHKLPAIREVYGLFFLLIAHTSHKLPGTTLGLLSTFTAFQLFETHQTLFPIIFFVGGNHEVPSLNVTTAITSATLNWTNPMGEPLTSFVYELQYYPSLFPFYTVTLNTTLTSHEVVKLIPQLRYEFRLRVYTTLEHGDWITVSTLLERKIRKGRLHRFMGTKGPTRCEI